MTKAKQTKQRIKTRIYNMLYHTSVGLSVCQSRSDSDECVERADRQIATERVLKLTSDRDHVTACDWESRV